MIACLRILPLLLTCTVLAQDTHFPAPPRPAEDVKLPNGKSQKDAILKADHDKNIEDADRLADLTAGLKKALEKDTQYVLSLEDLKKLDEIEKITKRMRSRMRRY
jgi:hypothetical protein